MSFIIKLQTDSWKCFIRNASSEMFSGEFFKNYQISLLAFDSTASSIAFKIKSAILDDTRHRLIWTTTCLFNDIYKVEFYHCQFFISYIFIESLTVFSFFSLLIFLLKNFCHRYSLQQQNCCHWYSLTVESKK